MSEINKRKLLESLIKKLPPEKQSYVVGVAAGLAISEGGKEPEAPPAEQTTSKQ